jgi:hypothetical protein
MPEPKGKPDTWVQVDDAQKYGRGGVLPMAVFLTENAPGLRTSPVKRGYWVVKRVLGETIPPPPPNVPELPNDEAKLDLPLREMLARHRQDPACAGCHARFDSYGLVMEGYGPVGEVRSKDLAGRPVETEAQFRDGSKADGIAGLQAYIHEHREKDFLENVSRKLLAYGLGRTLLLSDDPTVDRMMAELNKPGAGFGPLVQIIATSPQFLNRRVSPPQSQASHAKAAPQKGE